LRYRVTNHGMDFLSRLCWVLVFSGVCRCYVDKTVYQYLVDNGYSSFIQLVTDARLDSVLSGPGPVTVFAPSNSAIQRLDPSIMAAFNQSQWQRTDIIKYHMIDDFLLIPELKTSNEVMTMTGEKLQLLHIGHSLILNNVTRVDSPPNNDIVCTNGVVHPIDSLLMPPLFSTDNLMATLIERDDIFQEFTMSLLMSNLTKLLQNGEFTIFAPIDAAYAPYVDNILHSGRPSDKLQHIYEELFKNHIVPGRRTSASLTNGQTLYTLSGRALHITELTSGTLVDDANVLLFDIPASNGVIHAIDHLLLPDDLVQQMMNEAGQQPGST